MCKEVIDNKLAVNNLRCEFLNNPIGIDVLKPRFSWEIISSKRGRKQTAYQVVVSKSIDNLIGGSNLLYDTGKVKSSNSNNCGYDGSVLKSRQRYYWKVRIWDENDIASEWSDSSFWEMGLLQKKDWKAKWIEVNQSRKNPAAANLIEELVPCPLLRKTFTAKREIKRARIYATAHGIYTLEINGTNASNIEFAPDMTSYHKYLQYQTYDVTGLIVPGVNAIGAVLADGWYAGRDGRAGESCQYGDKLALLLQLEIEYENGDSEIVISDVSFKSSSGPFIYSDIFMGEKYDARLEKKGWSTAEYDDSDWLEVTMANYGYEALVAQYGESVRAIKEIQPFGIITTPKGERVIDLGQNIAGRMRMRVHGTEGTEIILEHGEVLDEEGNFFNTTKGMNFNQKDVYILKDGEQSYEPRFTYHGFRYVRVTGYPGQVTAADFTGVVLSSDMRYTGSFECSDERINRLQKNILWSQMGNMLSIPTDCPQRERVGWTGDIQIFVPTACFNMDINAFLTRWLRNLALEQKSDGQVPIIIPYLKNYEKDFVTNFGIHSSAGWGDACIIVPWALYNVYGNKQVLEENYNIMVKWVSYIEKNASEKLRKDLEGELTEECRERQKYLWNTDMGFGDWLLPSISSDGNGGINIYNAAFATMELVSSIFYAYSTDLLGKIAAILGKDNDAKYYSELNEKIRKAFTEEYLHDDGRVKAHFQGIYVLMLKMNMVPDSMRSKVLEQLVSLIQQNGNRLDTGFVSVPFLMDVLCDNGKEDLAYEILYQTQCPSWLYEVEKGATTIWEAWQAIMPNGKVTNESYNHYAFGCIGDWLYRRIAGLDKDTAGYKHIIIKPAVDCGLSFVKASYASIQGKITSEWEIRAGMVTQKTVIPAGTTASIYLPAANLKGVKEKGIHVENAPGILDVTQLKNAVLVETGSGEYIFEYMCKFD